MSQVFEKYVVFERARGYKHVGGVIFDEIRYFNSEMRLLGKGKGTIAIIPDEDIANSKKWTVLSAPLGGTAPNCVTDHDDSSYCEWKVGGFSAVEALKLDLSSPMHGCLRMRIGIVPCHIEVYVSYDDSNYIHIGSYRSEDAPTDHFVSINGFRYIKFLFYNANRTSCHAYLYSIEFYPYSALPLSRKFTDVGARVIAAVGADTYYQLLELMTL